MSQKHEKLKALLKELFQLDQPDLDFGLYRIMHAKSAEVSQFLDRDLLPQVKEAFALYRTADRAEIEKELAKVIASIEAAGMNPDDSPKVRDLRTRLASEAVDVAALESEVYDHLYSFFRRYYSEGDFLSKRVYKPGVYAIPYEGEEVKLHWANADQYYIKTSEYLRDYAFRLRPEDDEKPMRVHFRLADAAEGEHGNVKEAQGRERRFRLAGTDSLSVEDGELVVRFTYQPDAAKQKDLNAAAEAELLANTDAALSEWIGALRAPHRRADGSEGPTRLRLHLDRYTARNTFDYFIHKDLGAFLRRELDFYIKNEVMHLDDVENETAPRVEQYLSQIKVIRRIAGKIIDFLAQLENFQKKLWLKKKFVVETSYCIRVGCIPEEFYGEIAANAAQREEWVESFAIDEIHGDLVTTDYATPLVSEFLKAHPTLVVDTRHFGADFAMRLLETSRHIADQIDGVLFHSDNFQMLSLLEARYRENVRTITIDPPYNRLGDGFPYKDNYQHSSWLTMMRDRCSLAWPLLQREGALFANIDENEQHGLRIVLDDTFGPNNRIEELIWAQNTTHSQSPLYSTNHEYVEVYVRDRTTAEQTPGFFRERKPGFRDLLTMIDEVNPHYPATSEVEQAIQELFQDHVEKYKVELEEQGLKYDDETKKEDPWRGLYNYCRAEYRDANGRVVSDQKAKETRACLVLWRESDPSAPAQKQSKSTRDANDPNYRFYRPLHPKTRKPCPHPKTGWRWPYSWSDGRRDSFEALDRAGRIVWGEDETKIPQFKRFLHDVETNVAKSFFHDYTDGEKQVAALFGASGLFPTPKPTTLPQRFLSQTSEGDSVILDYFAGSGTTGHAVINLNREDGGRRKFILVEMADYFDTVMLPRLKKVTFTPEWKDGKPKRLATPEEAERSPRIMKVVRLESYEDTLNNLEVRRTGEQQALLDTPEAQGADRLREQYLLRYMLDVETRGSQSLLNVQAFSDPTAYRLKVKRPGSDESREVNVDLLETFNWLIGLTVRQIAAPRTFSAAFARDSEKRLRLKGGLEADPAGPFWFRAVTGSVPDGRRTLVIWRKLTGNPEEDNLVLDEWFTQQGYETGDRKFDLIYVNGGTNLENLKAPGDTWKVRLIEEDFHRLMFEESA
jgi:adenine-specific DNA-methyltransferase